MISKIALVTAAAALLLVAGALYQAVGSRRSARRYAPPGQLIAVDGQRLHLVCSGTHAPTVLFEAGVAASSLSWSRVLPEVSRFARTCAYDRAGLGWSEAAPAGRTVDRMIAELRGVLAYAAMGEPSVLVGHSFGTFLVILYASRYPADVAGIVLLDPPVEWQDPGPERLTMLRRGIQASRFGGALARVGIVRGCLALLTGGAPAVPRHGIRLLGPRAVRTLEHLVGEVRKLPPEMHSVVQAMWSDSKSFRAMAEHLGALAVTGAAAARVVSLGDLPLAVVSAADQTADLIERQRQLASLSTRGCHRVAANSGHWIHLDEPGLVVDAIREIVDRSSL